MSTNIPDKLDYINETKEQIKTLLNSTGQDTEVPFSKYPSLVSNIPNTGAISYDEINVLTELAIQISGERA